jgi:hypothetical protein
MPTLKNNPFTLFKSPCGKRIFNVGNINFATFTQTKDGGNLMLAFNNSLPDGSAFTIVYKGADAQAVWDRLNEVAF